jgi:succinylarginine dihydrolase
MALIAPSECEENARVKPVLETIKADTSNPIDDIYYLNLRQSMRNGGGPACLRLRVVLNAQELQAMHPYVLFDQTLYSVLTKWVHTHYRDRLETKDLADPSLVTESQNALDELTQILKLGSLYSFQM